jgi:hypothetical protein
MGLLSITGAEAQKFSVKTRILKIAPDNRIFRDSSSLFRDETTAGSFAPGLFAYFLQHTIGDVTCFGRAT